MLSYSRLIWQTELSEQYKTIVQWITTLWHLLSCNIIIIAVNGPYTRTLTLTKNMKLYLGLPVGIIIFAGANIIMSVDELVSNNYAIKDIISSPNGLNLRECVYLYKMHAAPKFRPILTRNWPVVCHNTKA